MDERQAAKIDEFILDGQILMAVRQHRDTTGSELGEAKAYVDARSGALREERGKGQTQRIEDPSGAVDQVSAHRFTMIDEDDLAEIRSVCAQLVAVM